LKEATLKKIDEVSSLVAQNAARRTEANPFVDDAKMSPEMPAAMLAVLAV